MANRLVIGNFDGQSRVRVSKPGKNVLNAALDRTDLAFDSAWFDGSLILADGATPSNWQFTLDYPDLGYPPVVLAFNGASNNEVSRYGMPKQSYTMHFAGERFWNLDNFRFNNRRIIPWDASDSRFRYRMQVIVLANPLIPLPGDGVVNGANWMIGERFGRMGVWVAKDGYDVLTCALEYMKFAPSYKTLQVIQSGSTTTFGSTVDLVHEDYGYNPLTIACVGGSAKGANEQPIPTVYVQHISRTLTRLHIIVQGYEGNNQTTFSFSDVDWGTLTWFRLNFPSIW